ncbi:MAG: Ribonuclease HII [candidate division WWE3 bacterium GW2011_GWF2_41_45]|uniref:Ribonuclease HII n=3 Tax=Katanobacteria TaxID=422282 RepID=A0A1F4W3A4_UNCKA|nr:MAG: Ribonuclease HII [candidate division WWE3 bacterium GW2011_GWC2_41_23]KKS10515.1 MAG: Ribonuclease HII [candidate division WWE3 bacterium GW2011_GWF2_41_45]KKS20290.1 MAG: Ribonuclease HII [candidate division WWE3 bacterium GW2011_GWE1_41_72]KKS27763.1 MAG: ribonuclease H, ribonuclease HII [candidate division WWE3 bacterium GW2011_GWC1_42_102]KKS30292.1 MAG: Ribonuclease HII [candidate division WWE3 bacterium GW2011_GWD2_42_11]KKS51046.1 MAG: Ribonuclease HII [candidate division WWE3 b
MRFPENFQIEKELYMSQGFKYIAGVDEVGRGPLAGPLVVAAAILDIEKMLDIEAFLISRNRSFSRNNDVEYIGKAGYKNITDSKKISANKRQKANEFLLQECLSYSITEIDNESIDREGMAVCTSRAFENAVAGLKVTPEFVITDVVKIKNFDEARQLNIISGDLKSISVGAASIIAKVYRDNFMIEMDKKFPLYGFSSHKGYGTTRHIEALKIHGPCEIHRKSFEPIASFLHTC